VKKMVFLININYNRGLVEECGFALPGQQYGKAI